MLTWKGVFNEGDRALINHKSVEFHRSSRCKVKNHQLGESKIGQAGSFSFIPVEGHKSCRLNFRIPRNFGPPHLHVSGGSEDRGITQ